MNFLLDAIIDFEKAKGLLDSSSFNIIYLTHDSSASGAPIVLRNLINHTENQSILLITFGEIGIFSSLSKDVTILCFKDSSYRNVRSGYQLANSLIYEFECISTDSRVICSSAETIFFNYGFSTFFQLDSTLLLHEHSTYYSVGHAIDLFSGFQRIIYSSEYVWRSWVKQLQVKLGVGYDINNLYLKKLPQPVQLKDFNLNNLRLSNVDGEELGHKNINVALAGHVQPRKGVHLFLNLCECILQESKKNSLSRIQNFNFTIIGFPQNDTEYTIYIRNRAKELEINYDTCINLLKTSPDYLSILRKSDICVCTSTVDPLPNIVFDTLALQKPTYIFSSSNGHEEYFRQHGLSDFILNVDNLRSSAQQILTNYKSPESSFNSISYLSALPSHKKYCEEIMSFIFAKDLSAPNQIRVRSVDLKWCSLERFSDSFYQLCDLGADKSQLSINMFNNLLKWNAAFRWPNSSVASLSLKYTLLKSSTTSVNNIRSKVVHILRRNDMQEIISTERKENPSYAIHIHAYYHDKCIELLKNLKEVGYQPDKFILTSDRPELLDSKLNNELSENVKIVGCENLGRNFLPLCQISKLIEEDYILHLHTKSSVHNNAKLVSEWNNYLMCTLLGAKGENRSGAYSDIRFNILKKMHDLNCSVAYALDPYSLEISKNTPQLNKLLPESFFKESDKFPYPCGSMFYVKMTFLKEKLNPIISNIDKNSIKEPLSDDGTVLHAIERSIPLLAYQFSDSNMLIVPDNITR